MKTPRTVPPPIPGSALGIARGPCHRLVLAALVAALWTPCSLAQHGDHAAVQSAGTIHGSKTPELIPDSMAYQLFFRAMSEPPNPSPAQRARQLSRLRPI